MNEWINEWMNQRINQCIIFDFFTSIKSGIFSTKCEMTNLIPIYKWDYKQNVKYYRLFFTSYTFWKNIWTSGIQWHVLIFYKKRLFPNQSGFKQMRLFC